MNDFEYDCLQKKRIAQSAKKKVHPKKGCSLPSDRLTPAQKKKLNGDVLTVNLNKPITYRYFKTLSADLQALYYNHLVEEFSVFQSDIAKMFGIGNNTLSMYLKKRGLSVRKLTNKKSDCQRRLENESKWQLFLAGNYPQKAESEEIDISDADFSCENAPCGVLGEKLASYRLEFKGVSNWLDIFEMLSKMPLPADATIYVNVGGNNG